jgi:hypothetical protein
MPLPYVPDHLRWNVHYPGPITRAAPKHRLAPPASIIDVFYHPCYPGKRKRILRGDAAAPLYAHPPTTLVRWAPFMIAV